MWRFLVFSFCILFASCAHKTPDSTFTYRTHPLHKSHTKEILPIVVIDPGHGGFDLGATTKHFEEKDACLRTSVFLQKHLEKMKYHVIMTRSRDEFVPLKTRAEIANKTKSHVLISVHFNAAKNAKAKGIEVFYYSKAESWRLARSKQLAYSVLTKMLAHTGASSRGVKEGNFCVIRETHMPAILIECGFLTNDEELKKITDDRYLDKLSLAIAEGLDSYFQAQNAG